MTTPLGDFPPEAVEAAAEAIHAATCEWNLTDCIEDGNHNQAAREALEAARPHLVAAAGQIATGPTVWAVMTRGGLLSAIFADEGLAEQWIKDNPTACEGSVSEPWHLHTAGQD